MTNQLRIVADEAIPLIKQLYSKQYTLTCLPAEQITATTVRHADALIIRTVTPVNAELLSHSDIRFVGSATAGFDHLDTTWLAKNNIAWHYAAGANAHAVSEYVLACLAWLSTQQYINLPQVTLGIIGAGHIGSYLLPVLQSLNIRCVVYDPPRAQQDQQFISASLNDVLAADVISLHPNLTRSGQHPSYHLLNKNVLQNLAKNTVIINSARGAIVDNVALAKMQHLITCIDTWEHEPIIHLPLLQTCTLASPHIAGYSVRAKYLATLAIDKAMRQYFNLAPATMSNNLQSSGTLKFSDNWQSQLLSQFDIFALTQAMKSQLIAADNLSTAFITLRKHYGLRDEVFQPLT